MSIKSVSEYRKEYLVASLDEDSADADPLKQFTQWFGEACQAGTGEPNAMVLSTADRDGNVSGRVVLLKGVEHDGFVFYTSYDSRKGLQLASNPRAALTFFWQPVERQVRVEGTVRKVPRKESVSYFNGRPADSRYSACISPQSCVIPDRAFLETMREGLILDLSGAPPHCPENWGGYLLKPRMIEFWQGRPHRLHDRLRYRLIRDTWIIERLAP
jgi:pyridoxamine 5'-phosphate oxidase